MKSRSWPVPVKVAEVTERAMRSGAVLPPAFLRGRVATL